MGSHPWLLNFAAMWEINLGESVRESLKTLHDAAQLLSCPIFSGNSLETLWSTEYSGMDKSQEIEYVRNFRAHQAFLEIERCDYKVFADRLTILSNVTVF